MSPDNSGLREDVWESHVDAMLWSHPFHLGAMNSAEIWFFEALWDN